MDDVRLIDANEVITIQVFDEMTEEYTMQTMTIGEFAQIREAVEDALGFRKPEVKIDKREIAHELLDMILDRAGEL